VLLLFFFSLELLNKRLACAKELFLFVVVTIDSGVYGQDFEDSLGVFFD
jgi:hypothetical protein